VLDVYERNFDRVAVAEPELEPDPVSPETDPDMNWSGPPNKKIAEGLEVFSGELDVQSRPGPTPESPTGVSAGEKSGGLRWKNTIELQLEPHTKIQLNPMHPFSPGADVSCVGLSAGTVRISRPMVNPFAYTDSVRVETRAGNIIGSNADFTVTVVEDKKVVVTVSSGSVNVVRRGKEQIVKAGETVTFQNDKEP